MTTTERRRILLVHRYYWPDVAPYASILRAMGEHFVEQGHQVEVLTGQPGYRGIARDTMPSRERHKGLLIQRLATLDESRGGSWRRLVNALHFSVRIFFRVVSGRYDIVIASTAPPFFLSGAAALASRFVRARFIYHVMDIHPEIATTVGSFRNRLLFAVLRACDGAICRAAARVVVLSSAMRTVLVDGRRRTPEENVVILNNPMLPVFDAVEDEQHELILQKVKQLEGPKLVFAGNLGKFQSLDALIEAFSLLSPQSQLHLLMFGSGKDGYRLVEKARQLAPARVHFFGQVSPFVVEKVLEHADVGVVSVAQDVDKYAFPSKIMNYLGKGVPMLAICGKGSPVESFVNETQTGWTAIQDNVASVLKALEAMEADSDRKAAGKNAAVLYAQHYSLEHFLGQWDEMIRQVLESRK